MSTWLTVAVVTAVIWFALRTILFPKLYGKKWGPMFGLPGEDSAE